MHALQGVRLLLPELDLQPWEPDRFLRLELLLSIVLLVDDAGNSDLPTDESCSILVYGLSSKLR